MRWLVLIILLFAPHLADAASFLGRGGSPLSCVYSDAQANGSCVSPSNSAQSLGPDSNGFTWNFQSPSGGNCDSNTPQNCPLLVNGDDLGQFEGVKAVWESSRAYFQQNYTVCGLWWQYYTGSLTDLASAPGTPIGGTYFRNTTKSTNYNSAGEMIGAASNGDALSIGTPPSGCWPQNITFNQTGMTITATGATFGGTSTSKGMLVIGANDTGGGSSTVWNGGSFNGAVRIGANATGVTIENATFHDACGVNSSGSATSCIEGGNGEGTVTLTNDTVYNGGLSGSGGQYHNVYLSANVAGDTAATAIISGLISYNVRFQGWTLKLRPEGETTQNHITDSYIGCTTSSVSRVTSCDQNGAIDMPCGGNFKIDFSTVERSTVNDVSGGGGYIFRALEEDRDGTVQCPSAYATTNNLTLDHDIIIWDGAPATGWSVTNAVCIALPDGSGNCQNSAPSGGAAYTYTCTITNSVIVGDSVHGTTIGPGAGCLGSGGAAVCSDGTNRCYTNRTAAATGEVWTGNDQFGNPCCAYPWIPTHL